MTLSARKEGALKIDQKSPVENRIGRVTDPIRSVNGPPSRVHKINKLFHLVASNGFFGSAPYKQDLLHYFVFKAGFC